MNRAISGAAAALVIFGQATVAGAQNNVQPSETTETFGAWTVRCQKTAADAPPACEVLHAVQGQGGVIAQIAIGTPPGKDAPLFVVQAPLGILLTEPAVIVDPATADKAIFSIPFQTCLQIGCLAQIDTTYEALEALGSIQAARLTFAERSGRKFEIAIPMNGLKDALARLRKV